MLHLCFAFFGSAAKPGCTPPGSNMASYTVSRGASNKLCDQHTYQRAYLGAIPIEHPNLRSSHNRRLQSPNC
jgi:hypothetical protein